MSKWTGLWRVQGHNKESNRVVVLKGDMEDEIHEKDYIENKITPPLEDLEWRKK
ncbi:hypothetical protein [Komagataeibacter swingsii]|uniref:Uncharacterized protein n=1 Tax=Komagataeibacter swingsii TaxID=215220 RepID=A0A850PBC9_9PROT|nr:hypothetical protein [Komagataeibacter swingsii]NVN38251.1 hypothetical protein [Komagataeibacter swingsii]GBQ63704.1 hypothetical protein AA16373_2729 [Komagataeibacter swingsii DSM 16373]